MTITWEMILLAPQLAAVLVLLLLMHVDDIKFPGQDRKQPLPQNTQAAQPGFNIGR